MEGEVWVLLPLDTDDSLIIEAVVRRAYCTFPNSLCVSYDVSKDTA